MVGVLVREDERPHIALVESQLVHAVEDLAACKTVVDHDAPLGPIHESAVPARAAGEDVQVQGHPRRRALARAGGQSLGGLRLGEVPAVGGAAVLQVARIGAG